MPQSKTPDVPAVAQIRGEWAYAFSRGLPPRLGVEKLSRIAGLPPWALREPLCRLGVDRVELVLARAEARIGDSLAALRAMLSSRPGCLVRYLVASQRTVRGAIGQIERFCRLVLDPAVVELRVSSAAATLAVATPGALAPRVSEACVLYLVQQLREAAGGALRIAEVRLPASPRAAPDEYERIFGAPVRFDEPAGALVLRPEVLDLPLERGSAGVARIAEAEALLELEVRSCTTMRGRAEALLRSGLRQGTRLSRMALARRLVLSPRSLERGLRAEGTSFREIDHEVRRAFAIELVAGSGSPLEDVALRCGFANLPAFSRAFRRWTGTPPSRFRQTQGG